MKMVFVIGACLLLSGCSTQSTAPDAPAQQGNEKEKIEKLVQELGGDAHFNCSWVNEGLYVDFLDKKLNDAGLERLKGLIQINGLRLGNTQITNAGLENLKGLTHLQNLNLQNTQITDVGLENLKELTQMSELDLTKTQITDAGLEHLRGLTQLKSLNLKDTMATDEGVKNLKQALPNCTIKK
jgi:hypothetical protein